MEEINLYELLRFYTRKWLIILLSVILGAGIGAGYTYYIQKPQYKSTATLLLVGTGRALNQESIVLNNYVQLFESRRVLSPIIAESGYSNGYDALAASTTAENIKGTDIINVSITTHDPKTSKSLLDAAIEKFRKEAKILYGDNTVKISVVDAADEATAPTNFKPLQQIALATIAAFALIIVALFFIYDYKSSRKSLAPIIEPINKPILLPMSSPVDVPSIKPAKAKKPKRSLMTVVKNLIGKLKKLTAKVPAKKKSSAKVETKKLANTKKPIKKSSPTKKPKSKSAKSKKTKSNK